MSNVTLTKPNRLLRIDEVRKRIGCSPATVYRLASRASGNPFPRPVKIGRMSVWPERDVETWIERQIEARNNA